MRWRFKKEPEENEIDDLPEQAGCEDLRDSFLRMLDDANLDLIPKYLVAKEESDPINGVIRTVGGYYRLAEDKKTGMRVLLFSMENTQLTGERQDNGDVMLPKKAYHEYDVYVVSARAPGTPGRKFREDMETHQKMMLEHMHRYLDLVYNETTVTGKDGTPRYVGKFRNAATGFGQFEQEDGKHLIRQEVKLQGQWDKATRFTPVPDRAPRSLLRQFFSLGRNLKEYPTQDDALFGLRRYWQLAALNLFKGRGRMTEPQDLKTRGTNSVAEFFLRRKYMTWGLAVGIGVAAFIAHHVFESGHLLSVLVSSGLSGVAGGLAVEKGIEVLLDRKLERHFEENDLHREEKHKPQAERDYSRRYINKYPGNDRRLSGKIDPGIAHTHLRLLDHKTADINHNDGGLTSVSDPFLTLSSLFTTVNRYFGTIFDVTHEKRGLMAAFAPNGLISLFKIDRDSAGIAKTTTLYTVFNPRDNVIKGNMKHLDPRRYKDTALFENEPYDKIVHGAGHHFFHAGLKQDELVADLKANAGVDVLELRFFGKPLAELFNLQAEEEIAPAVRLMTHVCRKIQEPASALQH